MAGRVAVITGGASGIGRATALALDRAGAAAIVVADLHETGRDGGVPTTELLGCPSAFVACDMSDPAQLDAAVGAADGFGGIDVLANVAGIIVTGRFLDVTEADYDRQMDVNAKGTFFAMQAAARRMVVKGGGCIVNVSSVAGLGGSAIAPAYSASKGAVKLMTYAAAQALGPKGIRVNAVHPGMVDTEMARTDIGLADEAALAAGVPLGRAATPEDVADAITFLCSDEARFISGTSLLVDGGYFHTLR
jgi:NAD(P)-dependent dehydrogenase (short-subunit alcohol dehydrogenase family)